MKNKKGLARHTFHKKYSYQGKKRQRSRKTAMCMRTEKVSMSIEKLSK